MHKLISDSAKSEISIRVKDIIRTLFIDDWQSGSYHQHQNFSERKYQTIKKHTKTLLNRTGAPVCTLFLAMMHIYFVLNHTYSTNIKNMLLKDATGSACDISSMLRFHFWQPIYFNGDDSSFPSDTTEVRGIFVGMSENVGHHVTLKILNIHTNKVINLSTVRPENDEKSVNLRADPLLR